jgi:hypothetical protein
MPFTRFPLETRRHDLATPAFVSACGSCSRFSTQWRKAGRCRELSPISPLHFKTVADASTVPDDVLQLIEARSILMSAYVATGG